MLDANDLQAIAQLISCSEEKLTQKINDVEAKLTQRIDDKIDIAKKELIQRMNTMETELYDEMDRYDRQNQRRFKELEEKIDRLEPIYRIVKGESDTVMILMRNMRDLDARVTRLEQQRA